MMSGAGFILAINLFVAGLLAASFMTIAAHDRRRISARWLALRLRHRHVEFPDRIRHRHARNVGVGRRLRLRSTSGGHGRVQRRHRAQIRRAGAVADHGRGVRHFGSHLLFHPGHAAPVIHAHAALPDALLHHAGYRGRHRRSGQGPQHPRQCADGAACGERAAVPEQAVPVPGVRRHWRQRAGLSEDQLRAVFAVDGHDLRHGDRADVAGHPGARRAR